MWIVVLLLVDLNVDVVISLFLCCFGDDCIVVGFFQF